MQSNVLNDLAEAKRRWTEKKSAETARWVQFEDRRAGDQHCHAARKSCSTRRTYTRDQRTAAFLSFGSTNSCRHIPDGTSCCPLCQVSSEEIETATKLLEKASSKSQMKTQRNNCANSATLLIVVQSQRAIVKKRRAQICDQIQRLIKFLQDYAGRRVRQTRTPNISAERKFTNLIKLKQYRVKRTVSPSTPTCWRQASSFRSRRNTISHRETKTQQTKERRKTREMCSLCWSVLCQVMWHSSSCS